MEQIALLKRAITAEERLSLKMNVKKKILKSHSRLPVPKKKLYYLQLKAMMVGLRLNNY